MKKLKIKQNKLSRQDLADPFRHMSYYERLLKAGSIDLQNNHIVEELEDGYIKIKPIDESKLVK
ncbi:hypothetical protein Ccar_07405 [Clostridium carboxidivorans P7]|uniref:Uncharacterized protein n=1 Tax=Clostridium carboxidivorans P7 TaxID=536227 RepID=C6PTR4_9CLOT|nr:hypothetical protein [Clostridium carboxidivorans]AKN30665.1 hypothetical protein Ccar_07405 [Clostridium carboxidivorans P7]EET87400.1 hypothetical protein CcarbDRAFT_2181 [Clostridium carboxidivorans P7]EFG86424.1 hypothetical protein CLCAR_4250 [Clostridium carboxidivorans P7]